jgi:heme-degrading monooxygenase HmoA
MYLLNEILVFAPGRHKEAIDRLEHIHSLMAASPGFRVGLVAKYLGAATRHTVLRFWEDEAAYQAFRAGPNGNYGRNRPEGLYTNEQVVPAWNQVFELQGTAQGTFLLKVQREIPENVWEAFGGWLKRAGELLAARGGLTGFRAFRAKDRSESLTIVRFRAREDFDAALEDPEFDRILAAVPEGVNAPKFECFDVVSEVRPQP